MTPIKIPLTVYVIWHQNFARGLQLANALYSSINRDINDPLSRGIGIPVYFRNHPTSTGYPCDIDLTSSEYTAIVLIVDNNMVADQTWKTYLSNITAQVNHSGKTIIFPVATTQYFYNFLPELQMTNYYRLFEEAETQWERSFVSRITHELCRLLYNIERLGDSTDAIQPQSPPPVKLFISHAKKDAVEFAKAINAYVQNNEPLKTFFDATDIPVGYDFSEEIKKHIEESVLLVIHSDYYSSREWCRREVIYAKRHNRPIVTINIFKDGEDRSFPYMANVPTIRLNLPASEPNEVCKIVLAATLRETLKFRYQELYIQYLIRKLGISEGDFTILAQPPELLTLLQVDEVTKPIVVYPDPPLGDEEVELLVSYKNQLSYITPCILPLVSTWGKGDVFNRNFLVELLVGISISESNDLLLCGYEKVHLQDIMVEFARHLLVSGAKIAYGGDVSYSAVPVNFAEILFDLARNHNREYKKISDKIHNYFAYPYYKLLDSNRRAYLDDVAKFIEVSPPDSTNPPITITDGQTVEDQYILARCLTNMREKMNSDINARVIIGGKMLGYKGKMPGVIEEVYLALLAQKPLYIVGAFGGGAKVIAKALNGETPLELTTEYQCQIPQYAELHRYYNLQAQNNAHEPINYEDIVSFFNKKGVAGLDNGLTEEENQILFASNNVIEIVSLVLKGLKQKFSPD